MEGRHWLTNALRHHNGAALVLRAHTHSATQRRLTLLIRRLLRRLEVLMISVLCTALLRTTMLLSPYICYQDNRMASLALLYVTYRDCTS